MVVEMKSMRNCGDCDSHLVAVPVPGIDTAVLVVKLHGAGDGLAEGETCNKIEFRPQLEYNLGQSWLHTHFQPNIFPSSTNTPIHSFTD